MPEPRKRRFISTLQQEFQAVEEVEDEDVDQKDELIENVKVALCYSLVIPGVFGLLYCVILILGSGYLAKVYPDSAGGVCAIDEKTKEKYTVPGSMTTVGTVAGATGLAAAVLCFWIYLAQILVSHLFYYYRVCAISTAIIIFLLSVATMTLHIINIALFFAPENHCWADYLVIPIGGAVAWALQTAYFVFDVLLIYLAIKKHFNTVQERREQEVL